MNLTYGKTFWSILKSYRALHLSVHAVTQLRQQSQMVWRGRDWRRDVTLKFNTPTILGFCKVEKKFVKQFTIVDGRYNYRICYCCYL